MTNKPSWIDHERSLAGLPLRERSVGRTIIGVSSYFSAAHEDSKGNLHGHTWEVLAWFECAHRADANCYKAALDSLLSTWDHTKLPPELSWGEDIAYVVGRLANCVEVIVSRPNERIYARWIV